MKRTDRVASQIMREVADIIQKEIKNPHLGFVTITSANVTPDLKLAKVYFSVLGDDQQKTDSHNALMHSGRFIRKQLAARLNMRYTPFLDFHIDASIEHVSKIDNILKKINDERKEDADID